MTYFVPDERKPLLRLPSLLVSMWLRRALVQDRSAVATEHDLQAVAQQAVPVEGHQRILLPANADIHAAAVPALLFRKLIHHVFSSVSVFANI